MRYALSMDGGILGQSWRKWLETEQRQKWDCKEHGDRRVLRFNCYISIQKFHSWHQFAGHKYIKKEKKVVWVIHYFID